MPVRLVARRQQHAHPLGHRRRVVGGRRSARRLTNVCAVAATAPAVPIHVRACHTRPASSHPARHDFPHAVTGRTRGRRQARARFSDRTSDRRYGATAPEPIPP